MCSENLVFYRVRKAKWEKKTKKVSEAVEAVYFKIDKNDNNTFC